MSRARSRPSQRILEFVDALPLRPGLRVLEIGCGPGVAARLVADRIGDGHVLAIDRSARAIAQARAAARDVLPDRLEFRLARVEELALDPGERAYDLAFAMRVGALDGRHPELAQAALAAIAAVLKRGGRLFRDGGDPLQEVRLPRARADR
jgi:ubiquinone/menaquinone biosynthesis C-methylase UbiE